jgi:uncharacterized protein YkwD
VAAVRVLRRRHLIAAPVAAFVIGLSVVPVGATDQWTMAPSARSVLAQINAVRIGKGLRPLRLSRALDAAADAHTRDMGRRGYFSHDSYDGTPFWKRVRRFYPTQGYRSWVAGENLLWATAGIDARRAVKLWMESPNHRRNILKRSWREIGIGSRTFAAAPGAFHGYDVTIITTDFGLRKR